MECRKKCMSKNDIKKIVSFHLIVLWRDARRLRPQRCFTFPLEMSISLQAHSAPLPQIWPREGWECCNLGKTSHPQDRLCHHCRHPIWTTHTHTRVESRRRVPDQLWPDWRRMRRRPAGTRWPSGSCVGPRSVRLPRQPCMIARVRVKAFIKIYNGMYVCDTLTFFLMCGRSG